MRDTEYFVARSKFNGHIYRIGRKKLMSELDDWELLDKHPDEEEEKPVVEEQHDDIPYWELRELLISKGVEVKGSPKKDELLKLYYEVTG